ncbi:GumC family protein [Jannaschia seohaensis]|uniref:Succinoglycan biosynthesis transport protein ExoP n=1 Tax=Jannaschia seohaensis TaxID=475081 RepID=A0A2Y9AWJ3_9RHOB|nr:polysaccharide biosynthesis tyrosine autokinase [Jannaschia seohaensis]PWJ17549.1 succinoglycan biosynthesis transport protein ExoP [Jannaschia seohaensis]SSA47698.1 succinoglycan biosynthesis transport protein ExoP [Jannaschia seohaensis]
MMTDVRPTHAESVPDEAALAEVLRQGIAFLRRWWLSILGFSLLGGIVAAYLVLQVEDRFRSDLLLLVEKPVDRPLEAEGPGAITDDSYVDGQIFVIESRRLLREVVIAENLTEERFFQREPKSWLQTQIGTIRGWVLGNPAPPAGPDTEDDPEVDFAVRVLARNLSVSREDDTNVIEISFSATSPRLAARVADAVGDAFVRSREAAQRARAGRVSGWLDERAVQLQQQVTEAEDAVAAFKIENDLIGGAPGQTLSEQQLTEFNTQLILTQTELAERRAAYNRAREILAANGDIQLLPDVLASPLIAALREDVLSLRRREAELGNRGVENPRLDAIRDEIATTEAQLDAEVRRVVVAIGNEVETLEARQSLLLERLAQVGGNTNAASRLGVDLRELERRAAAYRILYERYLSETALAEESVSFLTSGVEIIDAASIPRDAYYPPSKFFVVMGLMFGAAIGTFRGLFREAMETGFRKVTQVQQGLGLPVLACVPRLPRRSSALDLPAIQPQAPFSEAVSTLRHRLVGLSKTEMGKVVLLTSANPGEGKTSLAAALATSARLAGQSTLLIDADLRRRGLSRLLRLDGEEGLAELARSGEWDLNEALQVEENLFALPAGEVKGNPSDMLASEALSWYIEDARQIFDVIIIDGPPVANMADAQILAEMADSVAFVVRWAQTPRNVARAALSTLPPDRVAGIALTAVDLRTLSYYGEAYEAFTPSGPPQRTAQARVSV